MAEFDETVQYVSNKLTPVRDIILHLKSILIWEKSYHAPCIIMSITFLFMTLWLVTVPIISKLCFIGIIVTLLDYFLPILNSCVAFSKWEEKEANHFNSICELITKTWLDLRDLYRLFVSWKTTKTKLYYTTLLTTLMVISWIGTQIHNLLLLYMFTMFMALYPGLTHYNMIHDFYQYIRTYFQTLLNRKPDTKKQT